MLGISLAYLPADDLQKASAMFSELQSDFPLDACELHMEAIQFDAGFWYWDRDTAACISRIRERVLTMSVHLPYLDVNPISPNPRIARMAMAMQRSAIRKAAFLGADFAVFHCRGHHGLDAPPETEIAAWKKVVAQLCEVAAEARIGFCLENADDVRLMRDVDRILDSCPKASLCLDIGHLFERVELPSLAKRTAARLCDRLIPKAGMMRQGVPLHEAGGIPAIIASHRDRVRCVHLHNHDGTAAHRPMSAGVADIRRMAEELSTLRGIPFIVEADYRRLGIDDIRQDLMLLEGLAK